MARKPKAKSELETKPKPAPAQPGHDPLLMRLAEQIGRGYGAERMRREATALIAELKTSMAADMVRERLEEISERLGEGVEAAEEQGCEIDSSSKTAMASYEATLAALRATHQAFTRAALSVPS